MAAGEDEAVWWCYNGRMASYDTGATVCAPVAMDGGGPPRYRTVTAEELLRSSGEQNGLRDVRL
uniref:Uncharacterized protein n=1 Tax=Aegilops tauschii TaxID=37682 RepID=M8AXI2_AEGTA